jgi:hypothetical protein
MKEICLIFKVEELAIFLTDLIFKIFELKKKFEFPNTRQGWRKMNFIFGSSSKPVSTLGLTLFAKAESELAERKKRWDYQFPTLSVDFVTDVKAALSRELALHPEKKTFTFDPNEILADRTSYSKKAFDYICGVATKKLLSDEIWTIMHKVLMPALENQDVELDIDDHRDVFVISFESAQRLAEERVAAAEKAAAEKVAAEKAAAEKVTTEKEAATESK